MKFWQALLILNALEIIMSSIFTDKTSIESMGLWIFYGIYILFTL